MDVWRRAMVMGATVLVTSISLLAPPSAGAAAPGPVWMTPDASRPSTDADPWFQGSSKDASTAYFISSEPFTGVFGGGTGALFASHNGTISMLTGPSDGSQPTFFGSSDDGSVVLYGQPQPPFSSDLEMWDNGVHTTIAPGGASPGFLCASPDGSRVVFEAARALAPGGVDGQEDLYVWSHGTTTLLTPDPDGVAPQDKFWSGSSADCRHVFFDTSEPMVPGQVGVGTFDLYDAGPDGVRLISTGPDATGAAGEPGATFVAASADGSHVYFTAAEELVPGAPEGQTILYERVGSTTTLIAPVTHGAAGADTFYAGSSSDGSHTFVESDQPLVSGDTNGVQDVYDLTSEGLSLVSTPDLADGLGAAFAGASADGTHVFFLVTTPDPGGAGTDTTLYERSGDTITRIPTGAPGTRPPVPTVDAISADGSEVIFSSDQKLIPTAVVGDENIYVYRNGVLALLAPGADAPGTPARFLALSGDGQSALITTAQPLDAADTNGGQDIYKVAVPDPQPDQSPPIITISSPLDGAHYGFANRIGAAFRCTDQSGSGIASCVGTAANGTTVSSTVPGAHTFTVTSVDGAGARSSETVSYTVGPAPAARSPIDLPPGPVSIPPPTSDPGGAVRGARSTALAVRHLLLSRGRLARLMRGARLSLAVMSPGAGTLTVTVESRQARHATSIARAGATFGAQRAARVNLVLNRAVRKLAKHWRRLSLRLVVTYRPLGGPARQSSLDL